MDKQVDFLKSAIRYIASARRDIPAHAIAESVIQAFGDKREISFPLDLDDWVQKGRLVGIQKGRRQGMLTRALRHLRNCMGSIDEKTVKKIEKQTEEKLIELSKRAFQNERELIKYLSKQQESELEIDNLLQLKETKGKHKLNSEFLCWIGYEVGLAEGKCLGLEQIVLADLQAYLGKIDNRTVRQIQQLAPYQLATLQQKSIIFKTGSDLKAWLSTQ